MKKFISLMMAIFCVVTFSMSAFADSITDEPRIALNCPNCSRGGLVERKIGERTTTVYENCDHGLRGFDKNEVTYNIVCNKCSANCGYSEQSREVRVRTNLIKCGGI